MNPFNKTIILSVIGHLAVFGIFGFSFGNRMPLMEYPEPCFWGQFLMNSQVSPAGFSGQFRNRDRGRSARAIPPELFRAKPRDFASLAAGNGNYFKPQVLLSKGTKNVQFLESPVQKPSILRLKEPSVVLHPVLPYGFTLYFRDRQIAHVELEYKFITGQSNKLILLRRKVSSGNLEVDLLSMRYIWHYLFIQQENFIPGDWQTVKIDLSAQER